MERSDTTGAYIVIEGNDGTGKSTQVDMLAAWLRERGREVVVVEEPGSDDAAKTRSYVSTLVYQGYGEGVAEDTIISMTKRFTHERYMSPDFVVVLFANDQTRQQRIAERGTTEAVDSFESRDDAFQQKINDGYQTVARTHDIPLILAERSPTDVHQQILQEISKNNIDF